MHYPLSAPLIDPGRTSFPRQKAYSCLTQKEDVDPYEIDATEVDEQKNKSGMRGSKA